MLECETVGVNFVMDYIPLGSCPTVLPIRVMWQISLSDEHSVLLQSLILNFKSDVTSESLVYR